MNIRIMNTVEHNICIIGAGAIGTALGNVLSKKKNLKVRLLSIEKDVVESINNTAYNKKCFPNFKLSPDLKASMDEEILKDANIIFLAIPSSATVKYVRQVKQYINKDAIIVNLAKGFGEGKKTIVECLKGEFENKICSFKGPTFARELINNMPTAFTLGADDIETYNLFYRVLKHTKVYLDYSDDLRGVELLSILKNTYAIMLGIIDSHFNSANFRFLFLTKAFDEMRNLFIHFGGKEETIFKYCGFGDFGLTALNDLSRNRTLGLLIGKKFYSATTHDKILLEGKIAVNIFCNEIVEKNALKNYRLISELYKIFNEEYDPANFVVNFLEQL